MMAHAGSATVEMALLEPNQAQKHNPVALNNDPNPENSKEFQPFGQDGLTFWDFLDIINPLQHIPVISTLYRSITGDEIDPAAKIAGGTLYGGPIGAVSSLVDVAVDYGTGKDIGEHAMALIREDSQPLETAQNTINGAAMRNNSSASSSNPYLARAGVASEITEIPVQVSSFAAPNAVVVQDLAQSAGMPGIPIAKQTYADQIAAYGPKYTTVKKVAEASPDLGLLADIKVLEREGLITKAAKDQAGTTPAKSQPLDLSPRYSADLPGEAIGQSKNPEFNARLKKAEAAYQKLATTNDSWLVNSIMSGMDGLEKMAPKPSEAKTGDVNSDISASLH
jgi:hypothetical protein